MDKRKKNTVKIVSTVISLGIIAALIIGVVSVIKSVNANRGGNNNIVNLNETEENVAIKTEDVTDEIDELGTEEILQEANARGRMAEDSDISATESTTVATKENVTEEPTVPPTMSSEEVMAEAMKSFSFDESNKLAWPVLGHITLDYSMDETVLFKSLGYPFCKRLVFANIYIIKKTEHGVFSRPHIPPVELVFQIVSGKSAAFIFGRKHILYAFG